MFWVPIVIAAGAFGAHQLNKAEGIDESAKRLTIKSMNRIGDAHKAVHDEENNTQIAVERFANRKFGVLQTSIKNFLASYERLMKINFTESDGVKELADHNFVENNLKNMTAVSQNVLATVKQSEHSGMEFLSGMLSAGSGLLCMGGMAAFAVSAPISAGALVTALNPAFLPATFFVGVTNSIVGDSEKNLKAAQIHKKYANVVVAQAETNVEVLKAIRERADRLTNLLTKLNILFLKSIKATDSLIEKNGSVRSLYTSEDKEMIRNCLNLADAVKSVLDTPLFESDGKIAEVSKAALETGEDYLQRIEQVMSA